MLEFQDVWKGVKKIRRQRWLLAGANVALPRGRRIALLGAESADKTSVIRLMCGLDAPDKGAVRRVGLACWPLGNIAFTDGTSTLRQNANFLGHVYGVDAAQVAEIAGQLSGVAVRKAKPLRLYNPIERRQLALGLTLAIQFDWYFIDDALPAVTPDSAAIIDAAIADRLSRGSVVWAAKSAEQVAGYCDAGMVLDRGALTFYNTLEEASDVFRDLTETKGARRK